MTAAPVASHRQAHSFSYYLPDVDPTPKCDWRLENTLYEEPSVTNAPFFRRLWLYTGFHTNVVTKTEILSATLFMGKDSHSNPVGVEIPLFIEKGGHFDQVLKIVQNAVQEKMPLELPRELKALVLEYTDCKSIVLPWALQVTLYKTVEFIRDKIAGTAWWTSAKHFVIFRSIFLKRIGKEEAFFNDLPMIGCFPQLIYIHANAEQKLHYHELVSEGDSSIATALIFYNLLNYDRGFSKYKLESSRPKSEMDQLIEGYINPQIEQFKARWPRIPCQDFTDDGEGNCGGAE